MCTRRMILKTNCHLTLPQWGTETNFQFLFSMPHWVSISCQFTFWSILNQMFFLFSQSTAHKAFSGRQRTMSVPGSSTHFQTGQHVYGKNQSIQEPTTGVYTTRLILVRSKQTKKTWVWKLAEKASEKKIEQWLAEEPNICMRFGHSLISSRS